MVSIEELNISLNKPIKDPYSDGISLNTVDDFKNAPETPEDQQPGAVAQEPSNDLVVLEQERRRRADEVSHICKQ